MRMRKPALGGEGVEQPSGKVVAGALGSQLSPDTSSSLPWLLSLGGYLARHQSGPAGG